MPKRRVVTACDIAKACGVSQATVSYVLNKKEGKNISPKVRQLICETAKKLNYFPNSAAQNIRCGQVRSIGVVTGANIVNVGFNRILNGAKEILDEAGYSITLLNNETESDENTPEYIKYFRSSRIGGLLFIYCELEDSTLNKLTENEIPFICINDDGVWSSGQNKHHPFRDVLPQVAELCKEKSFRNINFCSFMDQTKNPESKYNLFLSALHEVYPEASLSPFVFSRNNHSWDDYLKDLYSFLSSHQFDLIISPNPKIALFVQNCILKKNFSLPQYPKHLCLSASCSFDFFYPDITSIFIPMNAIGRFAAEQLLRIINGETAQEKHFRYTLKRGLTTE